MRETKENKICNAKYYFKKFFRAIKPALIPIWFIVCFIVDILLIITCAFCLLTSFFLLGCIISCVILQTNSIDILCLSYLNCNCIGDYVAWFGVFSSASYIPLLALIFSEYHAAKVSQEEIENDISNSIESFKIREFLLGIDAKDSHGLYDALLYKKIFNDSAKKECCNDNIKDLDLLEYNYVIELGIKSSISEMFNLIVLYSYFQFYDIRLDKTEIIKIRDFDCIEQYTEELCNAKHRKKLKDSQIKTLCCVDDNAKRQSVFIFIKLGKNTEYNDIGDKIDKFLNDGYDNVSSYKKSFIMGLNFYPRRGPRKLYRYRLFPIIRTLYDYLYVRMISRRAMRLEFDVTEIRQYGCFNKYQHDYKIDDISFTHVKNIGEWGAYVRKRNNATAKNIDSERKEFINNSRK